MDNLDVALVRELFQGRPSSPLRPEIRLSYRALASRLGVTEGTIRGRATNLVQSGFIRGYFLHPNPDLLGIKVGAACLDVHPSQSKLEAVEKLILVEGTYVSINYHGSFVALVMFYGDERSLRRRLELMSRISGTSRVEFTNIPFPPCACELDNTDWKILSKLQEDIGKGYSQVGGDLDLSSRTIKRRVNRMVDEGAVFLLPATDETRLAGTIRADVWLEWGEPALRVEAQRGVVAEVADYCFFAGLWEKFAALNLFIPNVPSSKKILENVSRVRGVAKARIEFVQERREHYEVLADLMKERAAQSDR